MNANRDTETGAVTGSAAGGAFRVRPAAAADLAGVIDLDQRVTGLAKHDYWRDLFERYDSRRRRQRFFLVAEKAAGGAGGADATEGTEFAGAGGAARIVGFITGEVRAWEFGSAPCGWVFALSVDPEARLGGIGSALLEAISGNFRAAGIDTMRTVLSRDNHLLMSFFRSHGMMAGPYLQLEKALDR